MKDWELVAQAFHELAGSLDGNASSLSLRGTSPSDERPPVTRSSISASHRRLVVKPVFSIAVRNSTTSIHLGPHRPPIELQSFRGLFETSQPPVDQPAVGLKKFFAGQFLPLDPLRQFGHFHRQTTA